MKQTYLFTNDSTLMAFEGPVKPTGFQPETQEYDEAMQKYEREMSTARESALVVVNLGVIGTISKLNGSMFIDGVNNDDELKPGEVVPLPGWGLKEKWQYKNKDHDWWDCSLTSDSNRVAHYQYRQVYRLVRSESDKDRANRKIIDLAFPTPSPIEAKTQESQDEMWGEVYDYVDFRKSNFIKQLSKQFTITRK